MSKRYIPTRDLISTPKRQGLLPISRATLHRWLEQGKFPQPIALTSGTLVWDFDNVVEWIENQRRA
jgi:predicted DNA-binding transcriptional regulator AlpA